MFLDSVRPRERIEAVFSLLPFVRAAAALSAAYRVFAVSLAGGGELLAPHLPAVSLILLAVVPTRSLVDRWALKSLVALLLIAAVGAGASARELLLFGWGGIQLWEITLFALLFGGAALAYWTRPDRARYSLDTGDS